MRKFLAAVVLFVLVSAGCTTTCVCEFPTTPTVSTPVPSTPVPGAPTATEIPATNVAPLPTITAIPTTAPVLTGNLFKNPSFEGSSYVMQSFQTAPADVFAFAEINVAPEWKAYFCAFPYTYQYQGSLECPAYRRAPAGGNPESLLLRRPEYKPAERAIAANRVHSGDRAQQWFSMWGTMQAGVYQTVTGIIPGSTCVAGAYVQSWTTASSTKFTSDSANVDQRENMQWLIRIAQGNNILRFDGRGGNLVSRNFIFDHYDSYVPFTYSFVATEPTVTVGFETIVLYPVQNNNAYIDDAWLECTPPTVGN